MILWRCAWHRRYFGHAALYGVRSWRGGRLELTEGMCRACARHWRAETCGRPVSPLPSVIPPWLPRVGLAVALVSALVLAARPASNIDQYWTAPHRAATLADGRAGTRPTAPQWRAPVASASSAGVAPAPARPSVRPRPRPGQPKAMVTGREPVALRQRPVVLAFAGSALSRTGDQRFLRAEAPCRERAPWALRPGGWCGTAASTVEVARSSPVIQAP